MTLPQIKMLCFKYMKVLSPLTSTLHTLTVLMIFSTVWSINFVLLMECQNVHHNLLNKLVVIQILGELQLTVEDWMPGYMSKCQPTVRTYVQYTTCCMVCLQLLLNWKVTVCFFSHKHCSHTYRLHRHTHHTLYFRPVKYFF